MVLAAALHALMECARSEQAGTLSNELYRDLLAAAVSGGHFTADLLGETTALAPATRPTQAACCSLVPARSAPPLPQRQPV